MLVVIFQRSEHEILCVFVEVRLDQEAGIESSHIEIGRLGSQSLLEKFVCFVAVIQRRGKIGQTYLGCEQVRIQY